VRKVAKDLMPDEQMKESEKHAGRRVAVRNHQNATRLDEERRLETERFLAAQAMVNREELAGKAAMRFVMMMKQEAINVAFSGATSLPPSWRCLVDELGHLNTERPPLYASTQHAYRTCSYVGVTS
jgi:hypothetical protein